MASEEYECRRLKYIMEKLTTKNYNPSMSDDITALASAFLLAKKAFKATGLEGTNAHQKYNYAKIGDIYHAVEDALSDNKIIIWHFARPIDGLEYLYTRLIHTETGQFIEDCRLLESEKPGNQGKGAANTYMKKYALLSLCAIATEDDDGQGEEKYIAKKAHESELVNQDEIEHLQRLIKACTNAAMIHSNILKLYKIQNLSQLKFSSYELVKSYIANNKE